MIWDSGPWKDELLRTATRLEQIATRRRPSNRLIVELEKTVFLAAYTVRKLMEARLMSTDSKPIEVQVFPARGKLVTLMNWHRIDDLYDFGAPDARRIALRDLCNQLIHSYVFMPLTTSKTGPVKSILFASDRQRNNFLYEVSLAAFSDVLRAVGNDYPSNSEWKLDSRGGDYQVRNWTPSE